MHVIYFFNAILQFNILYEGFYVKRAVLEYSKNVMLRTTFCERRPQLNIKPMITSSLKIPFYGLSNALLIIG